jgi:hypothetical protein
MVDWLAKTVIGWKANSKLHIPSLLPTIKAQNIMQMLWLPQLLLSCKRIIKQDIRESWTRAWQHRNTGYCIRKDGKAIQKNCTNTLTNSINFFPTRLQPLF